MTAWPAPLDLLVSVPVLECDSLNHGRLNVFFQLVSFLGAVLVLGAYLASSRHWLTPRDRLYNLMNLFGGLLLLWVAVIDQRIGFIVLELAWAVIAIPPLLRPAFLDEAAAAATEVAS